MKKITKVLALSTVLLGAYAAQAHVANHQHQHGELYNKVQAMSPAGQSEFRQMMHNNMDKLNPQERQAFKDRMRASQGFGPGDERNMYRKSDAQQTVNSMTTMERAGFFSMMQNNMKNMSDIERHAFFDYMGFDEQARHETMKRLGIKHQKQNHKSYKGCNTNYEHNDND